jgi:putative transposase
MPEQVCYNWLVESKRARHATDNINHHFVWCPKYRRTVLGKQVAKRLEELIHEKTAELKGEVIDLVIQPDHVHLFCRFPPTLAPYQIMHRIKGYSAHVLREEFPWLKSRLPNLWTRSYYVGTAGHVSSETIKRYIEEQKGR